MNEMRPQGLLKNQQKGFRHRCGMAVAPQIFDDLLLPGDMRLGFADVPFHYFHRGFFCHCAASQVASGKAFYQASQVPTPYNGDKAAWSFFVPNAPSTRFEVGLDGEPAYLTDKKLDRALRRTHRKVGGAQHAVAVTAV